jgi:cytochrome o ubiquinol oxidase operon protein cyoD
MSKHVVVSEHEISHGNLTTYTLGFVLSLVLTLSAYFLVTRHALKGNVLLGGLFGLAFTQFIVQVIFFLHLGSEKKPRYNALVFVFMLGTVGIIVIGSIWIMTNLNYHHAHDHGLPKQATDQYIIKDEGVQP